MKTTITLSRIKRLGARVLSITLFLMNYLYLQAQPGLSIYTDLGRNNVSDGLYVKSAATGFYKFGKYKMEAGLQADLKNYFGSRYSGSNINASRYIKVKGISLEINGFYIRERFSDLLCETNFGALLKMNKNHFGVTIGTNFRTYILSQHTAPGYDIDDRNVKLHEIYNLMYSFNYYLKQKDNNWNVGLSVTNIDHFIINQETNPGFNVNGVFKLSAPVTLYFETWYKCAGLTNLELNHFGYFFRTGIVWNIK